jgi:hypothetical protein
MGPAENSFIRAYLESVVLKFNFEVEKSTLHFPLILPLGVLNLLQKFLRAIVNPNVYSLLNHISQPKYREFKESILQFRNVLEIVLPLNHSCTTGVCVGRMRGHLLLYTSSWIFISYV